MELKTTTNRVALSTVEAEAMALCSEVVETEYERGLAIELGSEMVQPTDIFVDNKGCRDDAYNRTGKRTRHINLRFHRVREAVPVKTIKVHRVAGGNDPTSSQMIADVLTKALPAPMFRKLSGCILGESDFA